MNKVVLFLADGFEEVEALSVVDILRRGNVDVTTMSITDREVVVGKSNIKVFADSTFNKDFALKSDMVILPGGSVGTDNLKNNSDVVEVLKQFIADDKKVSAICAAPTVLGVNGLLKGFKAVCYPGLENMLDCKEVVDDVVVCDRNIITSKGPATACEFGFAILRALKGVETEKAVRSGFLS